MVKMLRIKGHAISHGTIPLISLNGGPYVGRAYCECGAKSPVFRRDKDRREWHVEHKKSVAGQQAPTPQREALA